MLESNNGVISDDNMRVLSESIEIPQIQGEMLTLRAAQWNDFAALEHIGAFANSVGLVGKTGESTRAIVRSWIQRSIRWQKGIRTQEEGLQDAEARGVMAWSMFVANSDDTVTDETDTNRHDEFIGMAFLVDIDAWASSARIQVILGENYRGRGYTRDAMPRVMTYGFAPKPAGLGLHRIWISVPSTNTRSQAVYQSLGFIETGVSRDSLWDDIEERYIDMHVYDMLVDEYDPIRSLEAFGLHAIMDNPGVREALAQHEHTMELRKRVSHEEQDLTVTQTEMESDSLARENHNNEVDSTRGHEYVREAGAVSSQHREKITEHGEHEDELSTSNAELPWWRKLGAGRTRN
ncbi:N-acetyltransferase [Alloscardovia theropitheci]|uniref:N-acetyltransferase n=1 Tax=Alloscardovia theropitheci TaxID=2496842 RepID=A0A4V2MTT7_9BIFI|nr:GNAT family N-acetyltransferase [Alloscardovia theropitheci]TCD53799.1 N-acetyltransferase [Alloscardovia theropitheci]